jgi:predicted phage-related endonuclease
MAARFLELAFPQRSPEWYAARSNLITASVAADCLGLGNISPKDLVKRLREQQGKQEASTFHTQHGLAMEPMINVLYQILTGRNTRPCSLMEPGRGFKGHGILGASPDAVVLEDLRNDGQIVCEYKAPIYSTYSDNGKSNVHGVPLKYLVQMMVQMYVTGYDENTSLQCARGPWNTSL